MNKNEKSTIETDRLIIRKYSRWMNKEGRLLIVHSILYAFDKSRNKEDNIINSDLRLLDVHGEKESVVSYRRFLKYIIDGYILPWKDK